MAEKDQDKENLDEMGLVKSKPEESDQDDSAEEEDISKRVTDSADDIDDNVYRIVITCKKDHRVAKNVEVTTTISGEEGRHLKVVARNKVFYNSLLPKGAEECDYKIEKKKEVDLLYLFIKKSEPGFWTSKKK